MVEPHFSMLWSHELPRVTRHDDAGKSAELTVIAGNLADKAAPKPPPHSWASRPDADVAIACLRLTPGARLTLPKTRGPKTRRTLYYFAGTGLTINDEKIDAHGALRVRHDVGLELVAGAGGAELLLLQGQPIGEPVAQYGPFVMNTRAEIERAFADYQATRFGGWPWPAQDPVHGGAAERFAAAPRGQGGLPGRLRSVQRLPNRLLKKPPPLLWAPEVEASVVLAPFSWQRQRWSCGTPAMTWSTWAPHPAQVVLPHFPHFAARHMFDSSCDQTAIRPGRPGGSR
jgi:hypothetical protein